MFHLPFDALHAHRALATLLLLSSLGCAIETTPLTAPDRSRDAEETDGSRTRDDDEDRQDGDRVPAPVGRAIDPGARGTVDAGATVYADTGTPRVAESDAGRGAGDLVDAGKRSMGRSDAGAEPVDELEALRQLCVDEINRYRATVNAPPLARATEREACSDRGAQVDGDSGRAHGSATAGVCPAGAQNTCPGWPVGGRSGRPDVAAALKGCLKMMWDEGPPPSASCTGACFQQHGHYLNMSARGTKRVACGFYRMRNGNYWMNQNFW